MGLLSPIFRSSVDQPKAAVTQEEIRRALSDAGVVGYIGGGISNSGKTITPASAMRCSAVFACVNVIAQTVAQLPIYLYRRKGRGKELATDHPLFHLIGSRPNKFHNSFTFREMLTAHQCLRGDSFAFKNVVGRGRIYELIPLHPDTVSVNRDPATLEVTYTVSQTGGASGTFTRDQIFHNMGMTLNGYQGVSPLTYAREAIGLSLSTEEHGAALFKNGAQVGGVFEHPGVQSDVAYNRLKESIQTEYTGVDNAHKTIILEEGMKFNKVGMTSEDSQFLETRQFQIPEIARFYRMPLHKIQDLSRSTNNNIEHQSLEFLTDTMLPWLVRWEGSLNTQLLTDQEQKEYFFKFDVDDILRADMKSRYEAYSSAITATWMSPNEAREKEDMNPREAGDIYQNPAISPGEGGKNGAE